MRKTGIDLDYGIMIGYFINDPNRNVVLQSQSTQRTFSLADNAFSWWLIAFSLTATTIGSSFVKHSKIAYSYELYLSNLYERLVLVPLPYLDGCQFYFSKVSIPEYSPTEICPTAEMLRRTLFAYLIGYAQTPLQWDHPIF